MPILSVFLGLTFYLGPILIQQFLARDSSVGDGGL
jgi:hypothetical protein